MDDLMFGNESVVAVVGFEGDCKVFQHNYSHICDSLGSILPGGRIRINGLDGGKSLLSTCLVTVTK